MNIPNPFDKGAPAAPDYKGAAETQTRANRPNQSTPWANSSWSQDPKTGAWSQSVGLSGPLAGLNSELGTQAGSAWATPLDSGSAARTNAENAIYGRETARLNPMWDQRQHGVNTDLANQGIDPGSAAYGKAQDVFSRGRNDAYSSALMDAITGGGQEAQRTQGMDLQRRLAPLGAMQSVQGLAGMPGIPGAGNYLGAAQSQGDYGMQAKQYNDKFWNDLIQGGSKIAAAL